MGGEIEVGRRRSRLDLRRKKKGKVKCGVVDDHTCAQSGAAKKILVDTTVAHMPLVRHRNKTQPWRTWP